MRAVKRAALEVVSAKWHKDYDDAPPDYDAMGTQELILFDPEATARSRKRVRWQVFRRVRGRLKRVVRSMADRIESRQLGCFVRLVSERGNPRLRLATGRKGETLVPTETEAEAERAEAEAERAEAEAERAEAAERLALTERIARETLAARLEAERSEREDAVAQAQTERAAREAAERQAQAERAAREDAELNTRAARAAQAQAEARVRAEAKARAVAEARATRIEAQLRELQARVTSSARAKTKKR